MPTRTVSLAGGDWNSVGTWDEGAVPTAADDVIDQVGSGALTISGTPVCRSAHFANAAVTHNAAVTLSIGDGTAGAGNVAFKISGTATYTLGDAITSALSFISTSSTQQTITSGGKTLGNITINGSGSNYAITDNLTIGATATLTLTAGELHVDGASDNSGLTHSWGNFTSSSSSSLILGTCNLTLSATSGTSWNPDSSMTFSGASSTITHIGGFAGRSFTYGNVTWNPTTNFATAGDNTYTNWTINGPANKTGGVPQVTGDMTVSGTLTLAGNSAINRLLIQASSVTYGVPITITCNGTVTASNVNFKDITGSGSASWNLSAITGGSGDCGGNSGITFTTSATQTATGTASFTCSTHGWTTRVPLPQDDVVINNAFVAGRTITWDMPRSGKTIDTSGCTGSPIFSTSTATSFFGSFNYTGCTSLTGSGITFEGRGAYTLTTGGVTFGCQLFIAMFGGSLTLQDALNQFGTIALTAGTFDANNFNVTALVPFNSNSGFARTLNMGSGTWTSTRSTAGGAWQATGANLTINPGTSTIAFTDTGSSDKTVNFYGNTFSNITFTGGGTGKYTFLASATFNVFTVTAGPKNVRFVPGVTITVASFAVTGSSGNLIDLDTSTGAGTWTLYCTSQVSCDYLNLKRSAATGGGMFYAGANSTDGGGNTGWNFVAPAAQAASMWAWNKFGAPIGGGLV